MNATYRSDVIDASAIPTPPADLVGDVVAQDVALLGGYDSPILDAELNDSLDAQLAYEAEQAAQNDEVLDPFAVDVDASELMADALRLDDMPGDDVDAYVPAFAVLED